MMEGVMTIQGISDSHLVVFPIFLVSLNYSTCRSIEIKCKDAPDTGMCLSMRTGH